MTVRLACYLVVALSLACLCGPGITAPPPKTREDTPEVKKLLKLRRDTLKRMMEARMKMFQAGRGTLDSMLETSRQLLDAELELAATQPERVAAHLDYFKVACQIDELCTARYKAARSTETERLQARADRLAAEIGLRRAGGAPPKGSETPLD